MRVGIFLVPIAVFVLGAMAFLPLVEAGSGDLLFLPSPRGAGPCAHYAPLPDLSLDLLIRFSHPYFPHPPLGPGLPPLILLPRPAL